jgi:hypothetical protein
LGKSHNITDLLDSSRAAFRGLRLNVVETVFLAAAVLLAVFTITFYLTKITPRQLQLRDLEQRGTTAQAALNKHAQDEKELGVQRENAEKILASLTEFEERLKAQQEGTPQVITEFYQLAKANRLTGGGVTFRTIEPDATDSSGNPAQPAARRDKERSVFPALGLDTTVEGDYYDLRRYISDLERSKHFIVITSITLQSVDEKTRSLIKGALPGPGPGPGLAPGARPGPGQMPGRAAAPDPTSINVSLKLETDTYFQKRVTP